MKKNLLELELTNICNTRCIMCPVPGMKRQKGFMTRKTFKEIVRKAVDYDIKMIRFCGLGEPLLNKNFPYFLQTLKEHTHCSCELITNGSLLDEKTVKCLIRHNLDFLSISFPSLSTGSYQRIMKGLSFREVLEKVLYAVRELKKAYGVHIKITSAVFDNINAQETEKIKHFWLQQGVDTVLLHTIHNRGGHLKYQGPPNRSSSFKRTPKPEHLSSFCPWPAGQFFIAWDGSVLLCCCDMEGECNVGNIYKDEFHVMEKMQEAIYWIQPELCKRCSYRDARSL